MSAPTPQELTDFVHRVIPVTAAMGVEVVEAGRTVVVTRIPGGPNANHLGTTYAGSLFTVAELIGGIFASTSLTLEGTVPLVRSVTIDFLRPCRGGATARAELDEPEIERILAATRADGKADFDLAVEVRDDEGTVVATTRGAYQLRRL